jgi:2-iminobutanoate/2-iminopropanoate deaminase
VAKQAVGYGAGPVDLGAPVTPGILVDGWLYVSGQVAIDLETKQIRRGTIEEETQLTLENLGRVLAAGGCGFDDVVKVTIHIGDLADFGGLNSVYTRFFTGVAPARTTVQSVIWNQLRVEIDAVARVPGA